MATSMNEAAYLGVHRIASASAEEEFRDADGRTGRRPVPIPWSHLTRRSTGRAAIYDAVRVVVRILVVTLWLFPLLLVPKIVFWALDLWYGDLITVAFVILVVITFAGLTLLTLLHLLAGPRSARDAAARIALALPEGAHDVSADQLGLPPAELIEAPALEALARHRAPSGPVRLRGTIDAGLPRGAPVLSERWIARDDGILRVVAGSSFALRLPGAPLVVIELAGSPLLAGPYGEAFDAMPSLPAPLTGLDLASAPACILRQGDTVEILAPKAEVVASDSIRIGKERPRFAEGGPYRGERQPALLVRSLPDAPVAITPVTNAAFA